MFADDDFFLEMHFKCPNVQTGRGKAKGQDQETSGAGQIPVAVVLTRSVPMAKPPSPLSLEANGKRPKEHLALGLRFFSGCTSNVQMSKYCFIILK